ncbi:cation:proton antiporter [Streptomyces sp. NPDC097619]|uniref:cation:proton antiporter domain-containing protein n=1 Tax=Streptomyces sp. NPDC097619 TaxID=3157228 RepID=UPI003328E883
MTAFLIVLLLLFAWSLTADRLVRWSVTAPLAFAAAGIALTRGPDPAVPLELDAHGFQLGVELVLAVLLFVDATESKDYDRLEKTVGEWRLLGIALPVSVGLATLFGALLFPDAGWWLLVVTALVVMPMDLAPVSTFLRDSRVPLKVRAALNIEGGLNDGLISPVFVFCVANVVSAEGNTVGGLVLRAIREAGLALLIGAALGFCAGWLVRKSLAGGWAGVGSLRLAGLALPFLAYSAAVLAGGNGFVAAFVTGLCYAPAAHAIGGDSLELVHDAGQVMAFAVWFVFGALTADEFATGGIGWAVVGYGLLALTAARFVPVVLSLGGLGLTWPERATVGWLGSRGVTSIVFAVLAAAQLPAVQGTFVVNAMCATVLLSVVLHGLTVGPIAEWFERRTPAAALAVIPPAR